MRALNARFKQKPRLATGFCLEKRENVAWQNRRGAHLCSGLRRALGGEMALVLSFALPKFSFFWQGGRKNKPGGRFFWPIFSSALPENSSALPKKSSARLIFSSALPEKCFPLPPFSPQSASQKECAAGCRGTRRVPS